MENLTLYNAVRKVPKEAQKEIIGGRLKGMTDINPMWRIKTLTEQFGICGIGWKYTIDKQWTEVCGDEIQCHCNISLYIKADGEWSDAIIGTGGSTLYVREKSGMRSDDEGYKKALTDALSVACKALGFGADIYWNKDRTKYSVTEDSSPEPQPEPQPKPKKDEMPPEVAEALKFDINGRTVEQIFKAKQVDAAYSLVGADGKKAIDIVRAYVEQSKK